MQQKTQIKTAGSRRNNEVKSNLLGTLDAAFAQVRAEAAGFAAQLGLPAAHTKRAAAAEWNHWDTQSKDWDGPDLWRSFSGPIAARVRCLWALDICLDPLGHVGAGPLRETAREVDQYLEVLRTYAPKAAPAIQPGQYRVWLKQDRIEEEIRELEATLVKLKAA
jgi:hypothetical protein